MARYLGPTMRLARRDSILLPGIESLKRDYPPGIHGPKGRPRKMTQYGQQLREKQKAKRLYGIMERQFRNYVQHALRRKGDSAAGLLELLERRLDNVIYRLGWSATRNGARQLVRHGSILVDGRRINLPSLEVKIGQVIGFNKKAVGRKTWDQLEDMVKKHDNPSWLQAVNDDHYALAGKVTALPTVEEAERGFESQSIIEFYSK